MKEYKVMASSIRATYTAGKFFADSSEEACEIARQDYKKSVLGRELKDAGAFHFYTVDKWPDEE